MLRILEERAFPVDGCGSTPRPVPRVASCRSPAARSLRGAARRLLRRARPRRSSTSTTRSRSSGRRWPRPRGAQVIDNSAAFRMDPDVPLVVAEVNPEDMRDLPKGIASCPNCTTMVLVTALAPLHRAAGIERMVVSTYQSVSGAGSRASRSSTSSGRSSTAGPSSCAGRRRSTALIAPGDVWSKPIAGNVIPLAGSVKEEGYTSEEWKLVRESRKILHDDAMRVTATCVRVPVYVGHAMTANVRVPRPAEPGRAVELLAAAPGVALVDGGDGAPTPLEGAGIDPVLVGPAARRPDPAQHARPLGHRRQPAQGRGAQRGPDGRAPARLTRRTGSTDGHQSGRRVHRADGRAMSGESRRRPDGDGPHPGVPVARSRASPGSTDRANGTA